MTRSWYPDERAHAGPEHHDARYVAGYDRKTRLDLAASLELLRSHGLNSNATLVDLGCGTGLLAAAAASEARRVVGVDVSSAMLDVARSRSNVVQWVEAGFLTYEHQGSPPQLVHSRHALHHLPDFWKGVALSRIHDLLAPGGVLVLGDLVYDCEPNMSDDLINGWFTAASPTPEEGWTRAELENHVRDEQSTFTWLLEPQLEHAGFEIRDRNVHRGIYATYVCARR
ncbi:MAG TPA: class I SAM-dependent methyltransferase [Gaiellaceae bacterium]|nr:class I SAM-dependent methyltransferase [Gaiellaceae bacterium]